MKQIIHFKNLLVIAFILIPCLCIDASSRGRGGRGGRKNFSQQGDRNNSSQTKRNQNRSLNKKYSRSGQIDHKAAAAKLAEASTKNQAGVSRTGIGAAAYVQSRNNNELPVQNLNNDSTQNNQDKLFNNLVQQMQGVKPVSSNTQSLQQNH
jgi:hypothetical protein